jgi:protein HOOK3
VDTFGEELSKLQNENASLLNQIEKYKANERSLAESEEIRNKLQSDYQNAFAENIHLKNEIEQLKATPLNAEAIINQQTIPSKPENPEKLETSPATLRKVASKARLTKSKSVMSLKPAVDRSQQLINENRNLFQRSEKLELDNQNLSAELQSLRMSYSELEQAFSSLQGEVEALRHANGPTDDTTQALVIATQKLGSYAEVNLQLQSALKQARELIASQEKRINELSQNTKPDSLSERVNNLEELLEAQAQELLRAKLEVEDTRNAARREQRLIMSAWYDLGIQFQKMKTFGAPISWLGRQRGNLVYQTSVNRSHLI